ncbi:MAG TPA: hypothetical protein VFW16_05690 [Streptosporangiaceae bacterium]|nr:hypothetical protein [Streptosporangiaceae bacterium]
MSDVPMQPRWRILLTPRWLGWHLFAVVAVVGMCWLGDWQFRRAMAGNTLSWAYTFEWPIFAIFGVVFWVKTIRDELHPSAGDGGRATDVTLPAGAGTAAGAGAGVSTVAAEPQARGGTAGPGSGPDAAGSDDVELAEYNAYLARLSSEVKGHGKWHGLR